MEKISIKGLYTIIKSREVESDVIASFKVPLPSDLEGVVDIDYKSGSISVLIKNFHVEKGFSEALLPLKKYDQPPQKYAKNVNLASEFLRSSARKVLSLIKYHLRHADIDEYLFSVRQETWSSDNEEYHCIPCPISVSVTSDSIEPLRENTICAVQFSLSNGIEPLIAMRHIHRAKLEKNASS